MLQASPACCLNGLPVDPGGIVRRKKGGNAGNVVGLAYAAERCVGLQLLLEVAADEPRGVDAFGFNHAGIQRVDANLSRTELLGECPGDGVHCAFGSAVNGRSAQSSRGN